MNNNCLKFPIDDDGQIEDFEMKMLEKASNLPFLKVTCDDLLISVPISDDLTSLESLLSSRYLTKEMFFALLTDYKKSCLSCHHYLLNESHMVLNTECIFYSRAQDLWLFLYLPVNHLKNPFRFASSNNLKRMISEILFHPEARLFKAFEIGLIESYLFENHLGFDGFYESLQSEKGMALDLQNKDHNKKNHRINTGAKNPILMILFKLRSLWFKTIKRRPTAVKKTNYKTAANRYVTKGNINDKNRDGVDTRDRHNKTLVMRSTAHLINLQSKEKHPLFYDQIEIGRSIQNHLYIDSPLVSSKHARLIKRGQSFFLDDLNSQNGTLVNEIKVNATKALSNGDKVTFGDKEFIFIC